MRNLGLFLVVGVMIVSVGCAGVYSPLAGWIYTDVKGPIGATSNTMGSKHGTAEASSILGLVAQGDASIEAAATSAGITTISTVDHKSWSILGVYSKFTTLVTGN